MAKKRRDGIFTRKGRKYLILDALVVFIIVCFAYDFIVKLYFLQHTVWNNKIFFGICVDTFGKLALAIVPLIRILLKHGGKK